MTKETVITAEMKISNQLRWVGMLNIVKGQVEEIIWKEAIIRKIVRRSLRNDVTAFFQFAILGYEKLGSVS